MADCAAVVIIGGGIQGLSLAYHLALHGMNRVCLLEEQTLGSGSSGKSASVIGHAFQSERCLALTLWSFQALLRFEEELGATPDYEPIGCLLLGDEQEAVGFRQRHTLLRERGVTCSLIGPDEIDRLTPGLNLDGIELGLHLPADGVLDPHMMMMAYAKQARRRGVRILEGVEATSLELHHGRVTGVQTTGGLISTDWVVNAAGARAREVASWVGLDLPITNLKRHVVVTGPVETYRCNIPFTYEAGPAWYMRREGPGVLLGMGKTATHAGDVAVDQSYLLELIDYSIHRAPPLAEAGMMTSWAGLRPVTPDDDPILGPVDRVGGYVNDCGWGGIGVMNAPAAGMALAEWLCHGRATTINVDHFGAERFEP